MDNKWRFFIYDFDASFISQELNTIDRVAGKTDDNSVHSWSTVTFSSFLANSSFRKKFINRYEYLLSNELSSGKILRKIKQLTMLFYPEVNSHYERWSIGTSVDWFSDIKDIEDFIINRPCVMHSYLTESFPGSDFHFNCPDKNEILLFYQPNYESITIQLSPSNKEVTFNLFTIDGRLILSNKLETTPGIINTIKIPVYLQNSKIFMYSILDKNEQAGGILPVFFN